MRLFLLSCVAAASLAVALPAAAAGRAPAPATVTIVIPAFPAASVAAAIKKAMRGMPNIRIVQSSSTTKPKTPPGVLKFTPDEINRATNVQAGKIISLYPATLPKGRKGHLIVVLLPNQTNAFSRRVSDQATSVVQSDSKKFTLHTGEHILLIISRKNGWARVLPYDGPELSPQKK